MNDRGLRFVFDAINERYFANRISPAYDVRFVKKLKAKHNGRMREVDGLHEPAKMRISIHAGLMNHDDCAIITLIHEMAHADLSEYIGCGADGKYGLRFHAKIDELYKMGAYDSAL